MVKRNKNNKVLIGSIIIILSVVSIFTILYFNDGEIDGGAPLTVSFVDDPIPELYTFDSCNSEQGCLSYLSQQGMPENFLQLNGYKILCENENCYVKKI